MSDAEESIPAEFVKGMSGIPDAADPFAPDDEDGEDDDGLASVCLPGIDAPL
ncbi:hypothetical protein [Brevibacterium marinum]|uniref:Uncharacterized protein n=1 Tax=Brevibacterium marinum TaxID=418643 RepID=A0A846S6F7_9MICO|nr:hypothetical protein [Brevibacterium marinum]NJC57651.1 hypothetical protein [Brevibacterium marinum]